MPLKISLDSNSLNTYQDNLCLNHLDNLADKGLVELYGSAAVIREQADAKRSGPYRSDDLKRIRNLKPLSEVAEFPFSLVQGGSRFWTDEIAKRLDDIAKICYSGNSYIQLSRKLRDDVRILESCIVGVMDFFVTTDKKHFINYGRKHLFYKRYRIKIREPNSYLCKEINSILNI